MYNTAITMTKISLRKGNILRVLVGSIAAICLVAATTPLYATESSFSQGFMSQSDLQIGTVVSLGENGRSVEKSSVNAVSKMVGVVTQGAVLEVSDGNGRELQVATGGRAQVLVSDINGAIKAGDKITTSPINGVGMKTMTSGYIVGTAMANFSAAESITSQTVLSKDGKKQAVKVGLLPVQVGVVYYDSEADTSSILPSFLLKFVNAVAGKEVSILRISIAMVVLLIGTLSIGLILVSAVRSSIVSIGRNPLAARAVHRGLFQVLLITLGILVAMLGIIYIILIV